VQSISGVVVYISTIMCYPNLLRPHKFVLNIDQELKIFSF